MRGTMYGRDEGIYRAHPKLPHRIICSLCGRELKSASALARAAHGKTHVRDGSAIARTEFGYDGPRTIYEPRSA
jgi:hypothetical protein